MKIYFTQKFYGIILLIIVYLHFFKYQKIKKYIFKEMRIYHYKEYKMV